MDTHSGIDDMPGVWNQALVLEGKGPIAGAGRPEGDHLDVGELQMPADVHGCQGSQGPAQ